MYKTEESEKEKLAGEEERLTNGINGTMEEAEEVEVEEDDEGDLELVVVCSGDLIDEVCGSV